MTTAECPGPVEVGWLPPVSPGDLAWTCWVFCQGCHAYRKARFVAYIAEDPELAAPMERAVLLELHGADLGEGSG